MQRPEQNIRPFLKKPVEELTVGELFYVRNDGGAGYRPRQFVGIHEDGSYEYKSYMNNDVFAEAYEATHMDSGSIFVPKPFAMKIMKRAKELADEVMEEFADVGMQDISRISLEQQFEELADGLIGYDEYEAIKQTVRRLGWKDSLIVRRLTGSAGWAVDTEAFEFMLRKLRFEDETTVTATKVAIVATPAKGKSLLGRLFSSVLGG